MTEGSFSRYLNRCEQIYRDWVQGDTPAGIEELFDPTFVPEPYLEFGSGENLCVFVTTNPGSGLPVQTLSGLAALANDRLPESYGPVSKIMANHYENSGVLKGAARANIRAMRGVAEALGCNKVLQVEIVPWHSANFPNKPKMLTALKSFDAYRSYYEALREMVAESRIVLSWSRGVPSLRRGQGVEFKSSVLGLDLARANFHEISRTEIVSQALLWSNNARNVRGLFVNYAAANLPKREDSNGADRFTRIAEVIGLRSSA